jgi:hypothetical protein
MEEGYGDGKIQCEKENVEMEMASETTRKIWLKPPFCGCLGLGITGESIS